MQWRTLDGVTLDIKEMSDSHIDNALNMMARKAGNAGLNPALVYGSIYKNMLKEQTIRFERKQADIQQLPAFKRVMNEVMRAQEKKRRKFNWE